MATKKTDTKVEKTEAPKPRAPDAPPEKIRHHSNDPASKSMPNAIDAPVPRNGDPLADQRGQKPEEKQEDK